MAWGGLTSTTSTPNIRTSTANTKPLTRLTTRASRVAAAAHAPMPMSMPVPMHRPLMRRERCSPREHLRCAHACAHELRDVLVEERRGLLLLLLLLLLEIPLVLTRIRLIHHQAALCGL